MFKKWNHTYKKNIKKGEFFINQIYKEEKSNLNYILGTINKKETPVYYCCTDKGVKVISNLLAKIIDRTQYHIFKDLSIKSSFQIDNKMIVFKSNKIVSRGKNKLSIYNYIWKKKLLLIILKKFILLFILPMDYL